MDEKTSGLQHMMAAILGFIKKAQVKAYLEGYHNDGEGLMYDDLVSVLWKAGCFRMVDAICCGKVEQPQLHFDKTKPCPKMVLLRCSHAPLGPAPPCELCGLKRLEILDVIEKEFANEEVEVMVWTDARRQGQKNGVYNTQRELQSELMPIKELMKRFTQLLTICRKHCQEIRWVRSMIELDFAQLRPNTLLVFTDFAAVMALRAFQTKNASVDGHAVNDNFVCISNRHQCTIEEKEKNLNNTIEVSNEILVFDADVHPYFEETYTPGKKTDHAMHNICLDNTISYYKEEFKRRNNCELESIIVWTDNAPTQYRCRQNFLKAASISERHKGISITHRLAVVDNFKGFHDAIGKDPAQMTKMLELIGIRSPNAEAVFKNCYQRLQKTREQTEWRGYELNRDARLQNKGRFGMDTRTVWFVVETKEDQDRLQVKYPGRILLCDRTFVLDTQSDKAIEGTMQMHELRSIAVSVPTIHPRKWPARVANLPCNCHECYKDPLNYKCTYLQWRIPRDVHLVVKCLYPKEAMAWVGCEIMHFVADKNDSKKRHAKHAKAIAFSPKTSKWKVQFDDGVCLEINYGQLCCG